jgi:hypothetical protein
MSKAAGPWTGAIIHVHLHWCAGQDAQGAPVDTDDWQLVGWHRDGRPLTAQEVPLQGEDLITSLDFGDLPGAFAALRRILPGARLCLAGPCDADCHPPPFFQATRSLRRPPAEDRGPRWTTPAPTGGRSGP